MFIPDFDFGINILDPGFEVGLSAQQMLGAIAKLGKVAYRNYWMDRHFYLYGSYNFLFRNQNRTQAFSWLKCRNS